MSIAHIVLAFIAASVRQFPYTFAMGEAILAQLAFVHTTFGIILFTLTYNLTVIKCTEQPCSIGKDNDTLAMPFIIFVRAFVYRTAFKAGDTRAMAFSFNKFSFKIVFRAGVLAVAVLLAKLPLTFVTVPVCVDHDAEAMLLIILKFALVMCAIVPVYHAIALPYAFAEFAFIAVVDIFPLSLAGDIKPGGGRWRFFME